jgi:hypothetical protein
MTIGTAYGRIAGHQAAQCVLGSTELNAEDSGALAQMSTNPSIQDTVSEEY